MAAEQELEVGFSIDARGADRVDGGDLIRS
jgi:hypothetical protein